MQASGHVTEETSIDRSVGVTADMGNSEVKEIEHSLPKPDKKTNFSNSIGLRY